MPPSAGQLSQGQSSGPRLPHPRRSRAGRRERRLLPRLARPRGRGTGGRRNWREGRGAGRARARAPPPRPGPGRGSRAAPLPAPPPRPRRGHGAEPRGGGRGSRAGRAPPARPPPPPLPCPARSALLPRREKGQRCPNKAIGSQELLPKITPRSPASASGPFYEGGKRHIPPRPPPRAGIQAEKTAGKVNVCLK